MNEQSTIEKRVEKLESRVSELEDAVGGVNVTPMESDIETFVDMISPGTHVQRATTLAFFLVHEEGENPFTAARVEDSYEKCRLPKPANFSDVLAGAEERGWLTRSGTEGRRQLWTITRDGDKAVENGFQ